VPTRPTWQLVTACTSSTDGLFFWRAACVRSPGLFFWLGLGWRLPPWHSKSFNSMLAIAILLILAALLLLWQAGRQQRQTGLPGGRVIFADTSRWLVQEKPLYAPSLGLTGKPDYLVEQGNFTLPVEVKKVRSLNHPPYDSHIYQLAAYCLLVSELFEQRPPYGILHYSDGANSRSYAIDFTPALEASVRQIIAEIQTTNSKKDQPRSHSAAARCAGCGYRQVCDQQI